MNYARSSAKLNKPTIFSLHGENLHLEFKSLVIVVGQRNDFRFTRFSDLLSIRVKCKIRLAKFYQNYNKIFRSHHVIPRLP